jgi:hypothetical protein
MKCTPRTQRTVHPFACVVSTPHRMVVLYHVPVLVSFLSFLVSRSVRSATLRWRGPPVLHPRSLALSTRHKPQAARCLSPPNRFPAESFAIHYPFLTIHCLSALHVSLSLLLPSRCRSLDRCRKNAPQRTQRAQRWMERSLPTAPRLFYLPLATGYVPSSCRTVVPPKALLSTIHSPRFTVSPHFPVTLHPLPLLPPLPTAHRSFLELRTALPYELVPRSLIAR